MREIVVLSGKGGTGKTSVCASFAHLARNKVVCDLDVDAPDLHILLDPAPRRVEAFRSGNEAVIDEASCRRCGRCFELCRFGAVIRAGDEYRIDPARCEGCGVCHARVRPEPLRFRSAAAANGTSATPVSALWCMPSFFPARKTRDDWFRSSNARRGPLPGNWGWTPLSGTVRPAEVVR